MTVFRFSTFLALAIFFLPSAGTDFAHAGKRAEKVQAKNLSQAELEKRVKRLERLEKRRRARDAVEFAGRSDLSLFGIAIRTVPLTEEEIREEQESKGP